LMSLDPRRVKNTNSCASDVKSEGLLSSREDKESIVYKNTEGTFFCRLLKHQAEEAWYLYDVEVEEALRNHGIATACLQELLQKVPEKIYLQVGSYNKPAVHLYEKLGFRVSEELCYYTLREELV